jgi:hypothetical protein
MKGGFTAALLWALIVILAVVWLMGFLVVHIASPLIHLLLIIALIMLIWKLISTPRQSL